MVSAAAPSPGSLSGSGRPPALVVGGSRFVGPALVARLLEAGYRVSVLNRGSRNESLPAEVERIVCDRRDQAALERALAGRAWEAVFDVVAYLPSDTEGLLRAMDRSRLRHFVHVSTGSVYLPTPRVPLKEHFPRGPRGPGNEYGDQKYLVEELLFQAFRLEGLPVTIVRPGYIYGPRNYAYREAFCFDRLLAGRPLLVPGDGTTITQFGYVDDLAELMVLVLGNERAIGEAYNFAGEYAVTVDEYLMTAGRAVGLRIGGEIASGAAASVDGVRLVHFRPEILGLDDTQVRRVFPYKWKEHTVRDTEKARVQLGYREAVGLEEGLKRSLAWYLEGGRESLGPRADYRLEDTLLARLGG